MATQLPSFCWSYCASCPLCPSIAPLQKLYFCEYSLHFFKRRTQLLRHLNKCRLRHPPGDEIYRKDNISMFEVGWTDPPRAGVGGG